MVRVNKDRGIGIQLSGYTDSDGSKTDNLELSKSRVHPVQDYLIALGVPEHTIESVYYSEYFASKRIADKKINQQLRLVDIEVWKNLKLILVAGRGMDEERKPISNADWNMKFPYAQNEKQQRANRRVEIIVSDCDIIQHKSDDTLHHFHYIFNSKNIYYDVISNGDVFRYSNTDDRNTILRHAKKLDSLGLQVFRYTYHELLNQEVIPENALKPK